jgi:hypothetical protein
MSSQNKWSMTSLALGAVFLVLGILELAAVFVDEDWLAYLSANGNVMLGLVLLLTSAVFFTAVKAFRNGTDGDAYMIVGCMLGLFVGAVTLLTLLANASEAYLLMNEDFADWVPLDDFTHAILMMAPCLAVLWHELKAFRADRSGALAQGGEE